MTADNQGPEPTGWELMRGLDSLKVSVDRLGGQVLPIGVYNADKTGVDDRFKRAEARLAELEKNATEGEKLRRSNRLAISLAIASPIITFIIGYLTNHSVVGG